jgi:hypothetical protein
MKLSVSFVTGTARTCKSLFKEITIALKSVDSRAKEEVASRSLAIPQRAFLQSLHFKLGLMKNSVKVIDQNGSRILWFEQKFLCIGETKRKEGVVLGPFEKS